MKKINVKKLLIAGALFSASQIALAAWTVGGTVTKVQLGSAGDLFVTTTASTINPVGCSAATYFLSNTFSSFNQYYALLLTAKASGDNVKLFIHDTVCNGVYPLVQGATNE